MIRWALILLLMSGCSAERLVRRHCPCQPEDCANCADFADQRAAFRCHRATLRLYGYDYHKLDRDVDGVPCEPQDMR